MTDYKIELVKAIRAKDLEKVKEISANIVDINEGPVVREFTGGIPEELKDSLMSMGLLTSPGPTFLLEACMADCLPIARYLVEERGALIDFTSDETYDLPIEVAVGKSLELFKFLYEMGNYSDQYSFLRQGCLSNDLELVRYLIEEKGGSLQEVEDKDDPDRLTLLELTLFSRLTALELTRYLLAFGVNIYAHSPGKNAYQKMETDLEEMRQEKDPEVSIAENVFGCLERRMAVVGENFFSERLLNTSMSANDFSDFLDSFQEEMQKIAIAVPCNPKIDATPELSEAFLSGGELPEGFLDETVFFVSSREELEKRRDSSLITIRDFIAGKQVGGQVSAGSADRGRRMTEKLAEKQGQEISSRVFHQWKRGGIIPKPYQIDTEKVEELLFGEDIEILLIVKEALNTCRGLQVLDIIKAQEQGHGHPPQNTGRGR